MANHHIINFRIILNKSSGENIGFLIGGKKIGNGNPIYVIAEMAWSHDGELQKAKTIVNAAINSKANAICFHLTSMEDYMVPDYGVPKSGASAAVGAKPIYEFLKEKNLSNSDWKILFSQARDKQLDVLVMPNDEPSFNLAKKLGADGYVIAPATMGELEFLKKIATSGKPLFIRTGGATLQEIERTVKLTLNSGNKNVLLIHGFQSFPTDPKDMNMRLMNFLKDKFGLPVGFADHTDGASEIALLAPILAIGVGADLIEKHLTHDRSLKGVDFESALDPADFSKMVHQIREVETALGLTEWKELSEREMKYRNVVRKRVITKNEIKAGEKITFELITFKRANDGIYPEQIDLIIGKKTKKDIPKNRGIEIDMIG